MRTATALLCLLCAVSAGASDDELPFAVGEWAPYVGKALPGFGYAAEVVAAACRAAGLRARLEFYPWNRAEQRAAEGRAFASFPYVALPERESSFLFSAPLFRSSIGILRRADDPKTASFVFRGDAAAFSGFVAGTTAGTKAVTETLRAAGAAAEETETLDQSLLKLERGRIDFLVDERGAIADALRRLFPGKEGGFRFHERDFSADREYRLLVSRRYPDARALLDRFNAGLAAIAADGTALRIRARHGL